MTTTFDTTIRDIVANDFRAAAVFHRYGIDFCCRGNRSVEDACRESGIATSSVLADIETECSPDRPGAPRFGTWSISTLVNYIVGNHHNFVRNAIPTLLAHTEKVAAVHGDRHPELVEIQQLFGAVADEMSAHMFKEEQILFPYLLQMDAAVQGGRPAPRPPFGTVGNPIRMMEAEHESAGDAMARIRELSDGYCVPEDACTTYRVCFQELKAFEEDLHSHVHLENNLLFPKALKLEAGL